MATDVVMPQMGESITEGTLTKWLKKVGDTVQRDEPLFEISTDKVDAEIPSPAAGTLQEIKVTEGATVQINTIVAVIGDGAGAANVPQGLKPESKAAGSGTAEAVPLSEIASPAPAAPAAAPAASGPGTDVPMPQMGESITEGTITKWLKQVGESVARDEPLFEISTDKVDAEIPSPAAGILTEIKFPEGSTVSINTIVAVIGGGGGKAGSAESVPQGLKPRSQADGDGTSKAVPLSTTAAESPAAAASGEKLRSSPLVRKIAKDNNVDLAQIAGTGSAGRITKTDILAHLENPSAAKPARSQPRDPGHPLRRQHRPPHQPSPPHRSPANSCP